MTFPHSALVGTNFAASPRLPGAGFIPSALVLAMNRLPRHVPMDRTEKRPMLRAVDRDVLMIGFMDSLVWWLGGGECQIRSTNGPCYARLRTFASEAARRGGADKSRSRV